MPEKQSAYCRSKCILPIAVYAHSAATRQKIVFGKQKFTAKRQKACKTEMISEKEEVFYDFRYKLPQKNLKNKTGRKRIDKREASVV